MQFLYPHTTLATPRQLDLLIIFTFAINFGNIRGTVCDTSAWISITGWEYVSWASDNLYHMANMQPTVPFVACVKASWHPESLIVELAHHNEPDLYELIPFTVWACEVVAHFHLGTTLCT